MATPTERLISMALAGNGAGGNLLHLFGEDEHRRLCLDDKVADDHTDGYDDPGVGQSCNHLAQVVTGGHEAYVHTGQEQNQPHIGIYKTNQYFNQGLFLDIP